jgi:NAD(P)H-hydrate repair Nnr-like enzyme with NAD(P)H-hydrate epimerase domain
MPCGSDAISGYGIRGAVRHTYQSIIANAAVITSPRPIVALDGNIVVVLPTGYNPDSIPDVKAG